MGDHRHIIPRQHSQHDSSGDNSTQGTESCLRGLSRAVVPARCCRGSGIRCSRGCWATGGWSGGIRGGASGGRSSCARDDRREVCYLERDADLYGNEVVRSLTRSSSSLGPSESWECSPEKHKQRLKTCLRHYIFLRDSTRCRRGSSCSHRYTLLQSRSCQYRS